MRCTNQLCLYDIECINNEKNIFVFRKRNNQITSTSSLTNYSEIEDREHIMIDKINTNDYLHIIGYKFIYKGYRIEYSFTNSLKSLFIIHNEFINIWSHLLSLFTTIGFIIYYNTTTTTNILLKNIILSGSCIIFLCSSIAHLFMASCCSIKTFNLLFPSRHSAWIQGAS